MKIGKIIITVSLLCCCLLAVGAEFPLSDQDLTNIGFDPARTYSRHENVYVSPASGSYNVMATDLRLSWWNDFDLVIQRYYDSTLQKADNETIEGTGIGLRGFSMGKGWRMDLPYVEGVEPESLYGKITDMYYFNVTIPGGQTINVDTQMQTILDERDIIPYPEDDDTAKVYLEYHCGSTDFSFVIHLIYNTGFFEWLFGFSGWYITGFELIQKNGIKYDFGSNGSPEKITDATGFKHYDIVYWSGYTLRRITNGKTGSLEKYINFSYTDKELENDITVSFISYIGVQDDPYGRGLNYNQNAAGNLASVNLAGTGVYRTWNYDYSTISGSHTYLSLLSGPDIEEVKIHCTTKSLSKVLRDENNSIADTIDISRYVVDKVEMYKKVPYYSSYREPARTSYYTYTTATKNYNFTYQPGDEYRSVAEDYISASEEKQVEHIQEKYGLENKVALKYEISDTIKSLNHGIKILCPLEIDKKTYANNSTIWLERTSSEYNAALRMSSRNVYRENMTYALTYTYDNWGNPRYISEVTDAGVNWGGSGYYGDYNSRVDTYLSYLKTNSIDSQGAPWWENEGFYRESPFAFNNPVVTTARHDLVLERVIRNYIPHVGSAATTGCLYNANRYNAKGQISGEARWHGTEWAVKAYQYDAAGNLTHSFNEEDDEIQFSYNSEGNLAEMRIRNVHDIDSGVNDIVTTYGIDGYAGFKEWEEDSCGKRTEFTYDGIGRITKIKAPDDDTDNGNNPVTQMIYDDNLLTMTVINPVGNKSMSVYDSFENVYAVIKADVAVTIFNYDSNKCLVWSSGPNNGYSGDGVTPDLLYRPVTKYLYSRQDTKLTSITILPDNNTIINEFDYRDNKETITDPMGNQTVKFYDMKRNVLKSIVYNGTEEIITCYYYDGLGNQCAVLENPHLAAGASDRRLTEYSYNDLNLVSRVDFPEETFHEWQEQSINTVTCRPYVCYTYDKAGRKTGEIANKPGNTELCMEILYDEAGRITTKKIPYTEFDIQASTNASKMTILKNKYDLKGNKIEERMIDADVDGETITVVSERTLTCSYYVNNKLKTKSDGEGNTLIYTYYKDGQLASETDPRGYNNQTLYPEYEGDFIVNYFYDEMGKPIKMELPREAGSSARPVILRSYYLNGNLKSKSDTGGTVTTYLYTMMNRIYSETTAGARQEYTVIYGYDACGNNTGIVNSRGQEETREFDDLGRVTKSIHPDTTAEEYSYDKHGNCLSIKDGNNNITYYSYNRYDKKTGVTDALGKETVLQYDRAGQLIRTGDPEDNEEKNQYSILGQVIKNTDMAGCSHLFQYDASGHLLYSKDPNNTLFSYTYYDNNLLESIVMLNGSTQKLQNFYYDEAGNLKRARDDSVIVEYNYNEGEYVPDSYSLINSKTWYFDAAIQTNDTIAFSKCLTVKYKYDTSGHLTEIQYPEGNDIHYTYNALGQLTAFSSGEENLLSEAPFYDFQDGGILKSLRLSNNILYNWEYDANNRLSGLACELNGQTLKTYTYAYDGANNITQINNDSYVYDALDRLTGVDIEKTESTVTAQTCTATAGRVMEDYTKNASLAFNLDSSDPVRLDYACSSFGLALNGIRNITALKIKPGSPLPSHRVEPGALTILSSMNNASYTEVSTASGAKQTDGSILFDFSEPLNTAYVKVQCAYDDRDADYAPVDNAGFESTAGGLLELEYDENGIIAYEEDYAYDSLNNRTESTITGEGTRTYQYYTNSSAKNTSRLKCDGVYAYVYDNNGNLIKKGKDYTINGNEVTIGTGAEYWDYAYDLLDRLVEVKQDGVAVAAFEYDPSGLKVRKTAGVATYSVYGLKDELLYTEEAGDYQCFIYLFGKHFSVESGETGADPSQVYYYLTDHLGSVVGLVTSTGALAWDNEYTPFGDYLYENDPGLTRLIYTGKEYDDDIGLFYFNARWYDTRTGRFITKDPMPDGLNRYAYCYANPVNNVDPNGFWSIGLGIVFGYTQEHGWHIGLGAAFDFTDEIGLGANASLVWSEDRSRTFRIGVDVNLGIAKIGCGVTLDSENGINVNAYGMLSPGVGIGVSTSQSWGWDGSYYGYTDIMLMFGIPDCYAAVGVSLGSGRTSIFGEVGITGITAQYTGGSGDWDFNVLGFNFGRKDGHWSITGYHGELLGLAYTKNKNWDKWNMTSQTLDRIGKVWALPGTVVGLSIAGILVMDSTYTFDGISVRYNAVNFLFSGGPGKATTYGNIVIYEGGFTPDGRAERYDTTAAYNNVGIHEQAHTYQYQLMGIFFPAFYFPSGGWNAPNHSFMEDAADNYAMTGAWWLW